MIKSNFCIFVNISPDRFSRLLAFKNSHNFYLKQKFLKLILLYRAKSRVEIFR